MDNTTFQAHAGAHVHIVDDDPSIGRLLEAILAPQHLRCRHYASAEAFLDQCGPADRGCVLIDLHLPGMGGADLLELMDRSGIHLPAIVLTGTADVSTAIRVMRGGAIDLLQKPVKDDDILQAVRDAFARDARHDAERATIERSRAKLALLTPRERQVFDLIVQGIPNKNVARELSLSERTVEVHRGRVMRKMAASSVAELVSQAIVTGTRQPV